LRKILNEKFPGNLFYFLPADIVSQTLNFGLPAPFDIQIVGREPGKQPARGRQSCGTNPPRPCAVEPSHSSPADLPRLNVTCGPCQSRGVGF